jgi:hypothetical protein
MISSAAARLSWTLAKRLEKEGNEGRSVRESWREERGREEM